MTPKKRRQRGDWFDKVGDIIDRLRLRSSRSTSGLGGSSSGSGVGGNDPVIEDPEFREWCEEIEREAYDHGEMDL